MYYGAPSYNTLGDATDAIDAIPGVSSIVGYIQGKAKAGAEQAIPDIQTQVQAAVQPYVVTALLLGTFGLLFAIAAFKNKHQPTPAAKPAAPAAAGTSGYRRHRRR